MDLRGRSIMLSNHNVEAPKSGKLSLRKAAFAAALLLGALTLSACAFLGWYTLTVQPLPKGEDVFRIAFGSCSSEGKSQPILRQIVAQQPDLFVYLGDNIYGDTEDMEVLKGKYERLGAKEEFKALWESTTVLATWDDHDYGENDAGKEYPQKEASEAIFLDFWQVPKEDPRRGRPGVYGVHYVGQGQKKVQLILLDTRFFRDPLLPNDGRPGHRRDYGPHEDATKTILGEAQWAWLEQTLRVPAAVRVIATSTQFGAAYNGQEAWANFPREQERLLDILRKHKVFNLVFISGDAHYGEISKWEVEKGWTIYDVTSSGLTQTAWRIEPNANRLGRAEASVNFGMVDIAWKEGGATLSLAVLDRNAEASAETSVSFAYPSPLH